MPKFPQARMYLQSAQWGFDELLKKRLEGRAFCFYLIGILASLRTVQHALMNHDSTLSSEHKRVVEDWRQATPPSTPELDFIRRSRNLILKGGNFESYGLALGHTNRSRAGFLSPNHDAHRPRSMPTRSWSRLSLGSVPRLSRIP
jgi:hypothetical protein